MKDRFGAEIRTHYPLEVSDEIALIAQEADLVAEVPGHLIEVIARFTDELRGSSAVDQRSGVSARFAVAAAEGIAGAALRRGALSGEDEPVARVGDLDAVLVTLQGKVEFEMGEEGREEDVFGHLLRVAIAATYREHLTGVDLSGFTQHFVEGDTVETGALVPAADLLAQLGTIPGLAGVLDALEVGEDNVSPGQVAAAIEFVLEGLHLTRRLSKDSLDGTTIYGN